MLGSHALKKQEKTKKKPQSMPFLSSPFLVSWILNYECCPSHRVLSITPGFRRDVPGGLSGLSSGPHSGWARFPVFEKPMQWGYLGV